MLVQVMLGSTMTKLVSVFAVGLPLCLLGGLAYSCASGKPLLTGCLQAYAALYKIPGAGLRPLLWSWLDEAIHGNEMLWLVVLTSTC